MTEKINKILAIDTSCDETSAAVVDKTKILSNIVWSQALLHAKFGGVYPTLAKRKHEERINWVINRAIKKSGLNPAQITAVAVTVGPGLAPALEVGIDQAKIYARNHNLPIITVNHLEGHLFSALVKTENKIPKTKNVFGFPSYGLIISGGNTQLVIIEKVGKYKVIARTVDDALGEALDKAARLLGLGYPGGPILEKFALNGNVNTYHLPIPMVGIEHKGIYSYSGLKTAFVRLIDKIGQENLDKQTIFDLAGIFQHTAFIHLIRVTGKQIALNNKKHIKNLLVGGGVASNNLCRKYLRQMAKRNDIDIYFPYSKRLCTDNAAMIGIAAYLKSKAQYNYSKMNNNLDRKPKYTLDEIQ